MNKKRCSWAEKEVFHAYHDKEWGRKITDDNIYFEFLILEGAQAGLSWETILKRREGYRKAFANFNPKKVAMFDTKKINELLKNDDIIKNKLKIKSAVNNAKVFLDIQKEFGSFHKYVWGFVGGKQLVHKFSHYDKMPISTIESDNLSADLKKRKCSFVGSVIIYAFMQAVGLVRDHEKGCYLNK